MNETTYLAGKVLKQALPVARNRTEAVGLAMKRLLLPQGELAQFHDADDPVRYIAFIELCAGGVRGNHYHKLKEEILYVIRGEVRLIVEEVNSKQRETVSLQAGDRVVIRPGIAHALQTVKAGQAIEFSKERYDPDDVHRFPLT